MTNLKGEIRTVNRKRTDNTMAKGKRTDNTMAKGKRTDKDQQHITQKTKY
jgi:hypothetical protein